MLLPSPEESYENSYAKKVNAQEIHHIHNFTLQSGISLKNIPVAYKTWGNLNEEKNNVLVICHALTGSADVEDWWGPLIGPNRAFDTDIFFIACCNVLGSPYGSASPVTVNPDTGRPYGPKFPTVSIRDDVNIHKLVLDALGINQIQMVIGGSMGGMQALEWAFFGPEYVKNVVPMATSGRHSAWGISWGEVQRQSIYSDPNYLDGYYSYDKAPESGLSAARMSALLTYRSPFSFDARFGRKVMPRHCSSNGPDADEKTISASPADHHNDGCRANKKCNGPEDVQHTFHSAEKQVNTCHPSKPPRRPELFSAQSYLRYQGEKFVKRFDANCYISLTRKLDTHDIARGREGTYEENLASLSQPFLIIGIESDGLFTISEQYELANHIPNAEIIIIESFQGHDGFLLEFEQIDGHIQRFLRKQLPHLFPHHTRKQSITIKSGDIGRSLTREETPNVCLW